MTPAGGGDSLADYNVRTPKRRGFTLRAAVLARAHRFQETFHVE